MKKRSHGSRAIPHRLLFSTFLLCLPNAALPQTEPIAIQVDASAPGVSLRPVWNYFGYDEPNYTYAENGRKLIGELAGLSQQPVYIRTHNLLTTGDGTPALKWGSTNAFTRDSSGKSVYDWAIVDKILDTYLQAGAQPFVEIGFMPKALSTHPDPYQHNFPEGDVFTGWSYPPNDYDQWGRLVFQWAKHCGEKYGRERASSWRWEVWNEPDIKYWHGTAEEYDKLYDVTVAAVKRALPDALVGGPASTGPANAKAAAFLRQFLSHCAAQHVPLDFISFHAKGRPQMIDGHPVMGLARELQDAARGFEIVHSFEPFRHLPIVLSEADPEGCAACSARTHPENAYRNGPLYAAYEAASIKALTELAERNDVHLEGVLTWAFEFENQPYFEGFRTLATNGIDKPVLNFFRMAGLMRGDAIPAQSTGRLDFEMLSSTGARGRSDVDAVATRTASGVAILTWNYREDTASVEGSPVALRLTALPESAQRILVHHYRIDDMHSNSFAAWKAMGSPQHPTSEQQRTLERAGQLQELTSPEWITTGGHSAELKFTLPVGGLSLIQISW